MFGNECTILWVADAGVSGTRQYWQSGRSRAKCRKGLTAVCELVAQGLVGFVFVYKFSRLARSMKVWLDFKRYYLDTYGVRVISTSEGYDTSNPADVALINILMLFAQMEVDNTSQVIADSIRKRREEGYAHSPVFGWRWQKDFLRFKGGLRKNIERHPEDWITVRRIFDMCISGMTPLQIAKELMRLGIKTAKGNAKWIPRDVRNVMDKPAHRGLIVAPDGNLIQGQHYGQRIIEESEFEQVQAVLEADKPGPRCSYLSEEEVFYRNIIFCKLCGAKIAVRGPGQSGGYWNMYNCPGSIPGREHTHFSVRSSEVTSRISQAINGLTSNSMLIEAIAASAMTDATREVDQLRKDEKRLAKALDHKDRLFSCHAQQALSLRDSSNQIKIARNTYREEKSRLQSELQAVQERLTTVRDQELRSAPAIDAVNRLAELWHNMDWTQRGELVKCLVENITLEPTPTHVVLNVKLMFCEPISHTIYVHRRSHKSKGLDGATAAQLTVAYYLMHGYSLQEIAKIQQCGLSTPGYYQALLMRRAGTNSVKTMLRMVKPIVEERQSDLLLGIRARPEQRKPLSERETQLISLVALGYPRPAILEQLGMTVQDYRSASSHIYNAWQVNNKSQLIVEAARRGFPIAVKHSRARKKTYFIAKAKKIVSKPVSVIGLVCQQPTNAATIADQKKAIKDACTVKLRNKCDMIWVDADSVSRDVSDDKTGIAAVKAIIEERKIHLVVAYDCDDIFDTLADWQSLLQSLISHDVRFISVGHRINSRRDLAELINGIERGQIDADLVGWKREESQRPQCKSSELTPRQQQVILLRAQGLTHREIAGKLSITLARVGFLLNKTFAKLGVSKATDALMFISEDVSKELGIDGQADPVTKSQGKR